MKTNQKQQATDRLHSKINYALNIAIKHFLPHYIENNCTTERGHFTKYHQILFNNQKDPIHILFYNSWNTTSNPLDLNSNSLYRCRTEIQKMISLTQ